jgi:hypothetical protein
VGFASLSVPVEAYGTRTKLTIDLNHDSCIICNADLKGVVAQLVRALR